MTGLFVRVRVREPVELTHIFARGPKAWTPARKEYTLGYAGHRLLNTTQALTSFTNSFVTLLVTRFDPPIHLLNVFESNSAAKTNPMIRRMEERSGLNPDMDVACCVAP